MIRNIANTATAISSEYASMKVPNRQVHPKRDVRSAERVAIPRNTQRQYIAEILAANQFSRRFK